MKCRVARARSYISSCRSTSRANTTGERGGGCVAHPSGGAPRGVGDGAVAQVLQDSSARQGQLEQLQRALRGDLLLLLGQRAGRRLLRGGCRAGTRAATSRTDERCVDSLQVNGEDRRRRALGPGGGALTLRAQTYIYPPMRLIPSVLQGVRAFWLRWEPHRNERINSRLLEDPVGQVLGELTARGPDERLSAGRADDGLESEAGRLGASWEENKRRSHREQLLTAPRRLDTEHRPNMGASTHHCHLVRIPVRIQRVGHRRVQYPRPECKTSDVSTSTSDGRLQWSRTRLTRHLAHEIQARAAVAIEIRELLNLLEAPHQAKADFRSY